VHRYFLSPTTIKRLRDHKKWSLAQFGHATTKKYFQDLDAGFEYIANNHKSLPTRKELTGQTTLCLYPIREHYAVYVPLHNGVHIADILGQMQDIPTILQENAAAFQRELAQMPAG
jgi:plasmid stabilization system protein ParE